jgi:hypothetical protein
LSAIRHSQRPPASLSQRRSDLVLGTSLATLTQRLVATASPETGYWNMARQRYYPGLARCWRALRLSADRAGDAAQKPARKAGVLAHEDKVPPETDSPLEGAGFEPSVPSRGHKKVRVERRRLKSVLPLTGDRGFESVSLGQSSLIKSITCETRTYAFCPRFSVLSPTQTSRKLRLCRVSPWAKLIQRREPSGVPIPHDPDSACPWER